MDPNSSSMMLHVSRFSDSVAGLQQMVADGDRLEIDSTDAADETDGNYMTDFWSDDEEYNTPAASGTSSANPRFHWRLEDRSDIHVIQLLQVDREEIHTLVLALNIEACRYRKSLNPSPETALCVLLRRLSFPAKWKDSCSLFGTSLEDLKIICEDLVAKLAKRFRKIVMWHPQLNNYARLSQFNATLRAKGLRGPGPITHVWGFIDSHFRGFNQPREDPPSPLGYGWTPENGRDIVKCHAIVTPDGLISSLMGPYARFDVIWDHYKFSGVEERLRKVMASGKVRDKNQKFPPDLYLWGDSEHKNAFGIRPPFKHPNRDREMNVRKAEQNRELLSIRSKMERRCDNTQRLWTHNAFKLESYVKKYSNAGADFFVVAALLSNCIACLRKRKKCTGDAQFWVEPPSLEEYLQLKT